MERGLTKNQILGELTRSPHGKLAEYIPIGQQATKQEPEFMAHLIAWNFVKGQVRDAKVALPMVSLSVPFADELADNSLAHLAMLGPRELAKAVRFSFELRLPGRMRGLRRVVEQKLRNIESTNFDRVALQHRNTLKELYALAHVKAGSDRVNTILYGRDLAENKQPLPKGSVFESLAQLKDMLPAEAAGTIMQRRIPFLVAMGALGKKAKEPDLLLALMERMTPTELVTNTKFLERLGIKTNPALRGAYEKGLERASKSKANLLKTTRAAEAMDDESLKQKLRGVQERQIAATGGVEGNWLVLGDKSGSMASAIEVARIVAGTLAKMVKGHVWLTFFDTTPQAIDVTGLALDQIQGVTKYITAGGGTSIGCGLQRMLDGNVDVDGIAIVSDGGENNAPYFPDVYKKYSDKMGKEVPVYLYQCVGDTPALISTMNAAGIDLQVFDLTETKIDYYALPNLVTTMRTNRYSLIDEVMATPLLRLVDVFKNQGKEVEAIA